MDDLRRTRFGKDYLREFKDLYYFYLDDERRAKLAGMSRIRRAFSLLWWILTSLLLKLSPARRLLLLVALVFSINVLVDWLRDTLNPHLAAAAGARQRAE